MNPTKDITIQNLEDSSIRAQEIKNIHQKWGKYIDEGFGGINFWRYGSIIFSLIFIISVFYLDKPVAILVLGLVLLFFIYSFSKKIWFREGFYSGYDTGKNDTYNETLEIEGVKEAILTNRTSRK